MLESCSKLMLRHSMLVGEGERVRLKTGVEVQVEACEV